MDRRILAIGLVALLAPWANAQPVPLPDPPTPDAGSVAGPVNDAAGAVAEVVLPPATQAVYTALGQNITQEDVRLFLDLNVSKGEITPLGFLVGSGNIELQADIHVRGELRVISSDRIRAALEGENAYNITAENATGLSDAFIPAEAFRATLAAEVVAAFQSDMEASLAKMIEETVPELNIISISMNWQNTSPLMSFTDFSLTEPPLVVELDATVEYVRVESLGNLFRLYMAGQENKDESKGDYVKAAKADAADPLKTRDFFAAAAYDQLLNLSLQPGWSLDVSLAVPRGYSFEYTNEDVETVNSRNLAFTVDGDVATEEDPLVFIASITHRRAVAFAMLLALLVTVAVVGTPVNMLYHRFRHGKSKASAGADGGADDVPAS